MTIRAGIEVHNPLGPGLADHQPNVTSSLLDASSFQFTMASMIDRMLDGAIAHHAAGRLGDAEPMLREVLAEQPDNADALHYLGLLLHQTGRSGEGLPLLGRSVAEAMP